MKSFRETLSENLIDKEPTHVTNKVTNDGQDEFEAGIKLRQVLGSNKLYMVLSGPNRGQLFRYSKSDVTPV